MPKIISTGGGKGGIGKSFFSANLGGLFSMIGKKTLLIDLDTGGPNLHSFFNITNPHTGLNDFLNQKSSLENCVIETKFDRLYILNSKNCQADLGNISYSMRHLLLKEIKKLKYDYIILDLGAGTNKYLIDFFLAADYPFALFTTDPLSLENTFRFVHKVFTHKIMKTVPVRKLSKTVPKGSSFRPADILEIFKKNNNPYYDRLKNTLDNFYVYLAASQTQGQLDSIQHIEVFYKKFFGENVIFTGSVPFNPEVKKFILQRKLFVSGPKDNKTVKGLMGIAKSLL